MPDIAPTPRAPLPAADALVPPRSIAARWDVAILSSRTGCEVRACALALGLAWPRFLRRHPYAGDALAYSTHVLDTLSGEGYSLGEIVAAGELAIGVISEALPAVEGADPT